MELRFRDLRVVSTGRIPVIGREGSYSLSALRVLVTEVLLPLFGCDRPAVFSIQ